LNKTSASVKLKLLSASIAVLIFIVLYTTGVCFAFFRISSHPDELKIWMAAAAVMGLIGGITLSIWASYLSKKIYNPIDDIERVVSYIGKTGDFELPEEHRAVLKKYRDSVAEYDSLARSIGEMVDGLEAKVDTLKEISKGDLTKQVPLLSDLDVVGIAINDMITRISAAVRDVSISTGQLSNGAAQLSSGAQSLAHSSSEQSTSVDQLNIAAGSIANEAKENLERATVASRLTADIRRSAEEGGVHMKNMNQAMGEISDASHSIKSVMKIIDEIAFQTNILSLNAAVEAARAGSHGKGFAVVADEVRSLATKSSNAASDSNKLIADTIVKSEQGAAIVGKAIEFFLTIEDGIAKISNHLDEISASAENQRNSIEAISSSVQDLTSVVYNNSAISQESAAASEEMNSQAELLSEMVAQFKLDNPLRSEKPLNIPAFPFHDRHMEGKLPSHTHEVNEEAGISPAEAYRAASSELKGDEQEFVDDISKY
jgi:methyl-accepting chemotaxis protein